MKKDYLKISSKSFKSRLIVGTGKYKSFFRVCKSDKAADADMVTVVSEEGKYIR